MGKPRFSSVMMQILGYLKTEKAYLLEDDKWGVDTQYIFQLLQKMEPGYLLIMTFQKES